MRRVGGFGFDVPGTVLGLVLVLAGCSEAAPGGDGGAPVDPSAPRPAAVGADGGAVDVGGCAADGSAGAVADGATSDAPSFTDASADDAADAGGADETGFVPLFDGTTLAGWAMAGLGKFVVLDGALDALPGAGLGLLWSTVPTPADFVLRLQYRRSADDDNSGVFVRFPDPTSKGYDNTAWVAVNFGFEIQIDDHGLPDGAPMHTTGSVYSQPNQAFSLVPSKPVPAWNDYEITAQGQTYTVRLNGVQTTRFVFAGDPQTPDRGAPSAPGAPRYVGLQAHTGLVSFRNVRIKPL